MVKNYTIETSPSDSAYRHTEENNNKIFSNLMYKEPSEWWERWFLSTNAKDIGTLYLMFSLFSGLIGTGLSLLIRLELSAPGVQYIGDTQLYNNLITSHAIFMIFFMVYIFKMLNMKS